MKATKRFTCEVTAFLLDEPADIGVKPRFQWLGIGTAHVFDPTYRGSFTDATGVIPGEAMRVVQGKVFSQTRDGALKSALSALLEQMGHIDTESPDAL
jgi:hypothetical protein